jgi:COP9 signalosome complex subunit 4
LLSVRVLCQISALKLQLADLLEADEDWQEAAKVLMGVPLDSNNACVARTLD